MIFGAHLILYSTDADADRTFLRDVLGLKWMDAGHGWLIFAMPPAEVAVHPAEGSDRQELYLLCDDLQAEMAALAANGVRCNEVQTAGWGTFTHFSLPGGGSVGLYEPRHALALQRADRPGASA